MTTDITKNNEDKIAQLRAMSGEAQNTMIKTVVPMIQINNDKVEKEVDGETVEVLGEKRWDCVSKNDNNEYLKELFAPEFQGVILKIRYVITKKYNPSDKTPNWRSHEFDSFKDYIKLFSDGDVYYEGSYQNIKKEFEGKTSIQAVVYTLINDKVYKVILKGGSLGKLWDYLKTFGSNDSSSAHLTNFGLVKEKGAGFSYHVVDLKVAEDDQVDIDQVLSMQTEINQTLQEMKDSYEKKNSQDPEVIPAEKKEPTDEEIDAAVIKSFEEHENQNKQ